MAAQPAPAPQPSSASQARGYVQFAIFGLALAMAISFLAGREGAGPRLIPNKWLNQDGTFYYLTLRTLTDRHTLAQDETQPRSWYEQDLRWNANLPPDWSDVAVGRDGHWYPKHPILLPLATIPFEWAYGAWGALVVNLLCLALIPVFAYRIARHLAPWPVAAIAAAVLASSEFLSGQAYHYSNDLFCGLLAVATFERALAGKPGAAGLLFGLSVFGKSTNAVFLPALVLIFALKKDWKSVGRAAAFAAPVLLVYAALNTWMYGAPWATGYNHILVRVNGQQAFHSHAADFDWPNLGRYLKEVLWTRQGSFGMHDRAFFWLFALPGALVALVRAPKVALPLLLGAIGPLIFNASFKYFRVEFLDGTVALSIGFIAALLVPWLKAPVEEPEPPPRVRWDRLAPVLGAVVLLASGAVRAAVEPRGDYFERRLERARNELEIVQPVHVTIPCDYFNWQVQRWECSNFDRGQDGWMTGRSVSAQPHFGGKTQPLLQIAPRSGAVRRLTYEGVPLGDKLEVRYGLADGTVASPELRFVVKVNEVEHVLALGGPGEVKTEAIDTAQAKGQLAKVTFEITSPRGDGDASVYFDGGPH